MSNEIDIKGLDKATLLAGLYNNSKPQGLGFLNADPKPMTRDQAELIIQTQGMNFDYLQGRVMKINIAGDSMFTHGYNRDNGKDAAEHVVSTIKSGQMPGKQHDRSEEFAAGAIKVAISAKPSKMAQDVFTLGVDDELREALFDSAERMKGNPTNKGGSKPNP